MWIILIIFIVTATVLPIISCAILAPVENYVCVYNAKPLSLFFAKGLAYFLLIFYLPTLMMVGILKCLFFSESRGFNALLETQQANWDIIDYYPEEEQTIENPTE